MDNTVIILIGAGVSCVVIGFALFGKLGKMGESLCEIDKSDIKSVPERSYRETIKKMLKPEINKEEFFDGHVSDKDECCR